MCVVFFAFPKDQDASSFYSHLKHPCHYYPSYDFHLHGLDKRRLYKRTQVLAGLLTHSSDQKPYVVITSDEALEGPVIPKVLFEKRFLSISYKESLDLDECVDFLETQLGYKKALELQEPGFFRLRGGMLDVFSPFYESPLKIEFFGDLIASIRSSQGEIMPKGLITSWEDPLGFYHGSLFEYPQTPYYRLTVQDQTSLLESFFSPSDVEFLKGDLVVYETYGVGKFLGIESIGTSSEDFLALEYQKGDKIYVPLHHLPKVVFCDEMRDIDQIRSLSWQEKQQKAKAEVEEIAGQILVQDAKRQLVRIKRDPVIDQDPGLIEEGFPYELTWDQQKALRAIEQDRQKPYPMDRLIIGDAGYGKTEIAIRTAYQTVLSGKKVLFLVPTTILASQHGKTFHKRLEPLGVRVKEIHRFIKSQKTMVKAFLEGQIDILIGTHRILNQDLREAKDVGLVIIDEEHRFGVTHKELIRNLAIEADLLTLSATPIPRTLHMALTGLKDVSFLKTPPFLRKPVLIHKTSFQEGFLKKVILEELKRQGQVFFLHNRIGDLPHILALVSSWIGSQKARIAHGQLEEQELEKVMLDFSEGRFPVLITTTIVESGIDIPNANTMIIHKAQTFGIAQLYQLCGRVGRSSVQGYVYLVTDEDDHERLDFFSSGGTLLSSEKLSKEDLKQRGAGNLLGHSQSGHAYHVGHQLYARMLSQEIRKLKGVNTDFLPKGISLPKELMLSEKERLMLYQKIYSCQNVEEFAALKEQIFQKLSIRL